MRRTSSRDSENEAGSPNTGRPSEPSSRSRAWRRKYEMSATRTLRLCALSRPALCARVTRASNSSGLDGSELSTTITPPCGMPSWPPSVRLPMYA